MKLRLVTIICIMASTSYIGASAPLPEQSVDVAFFGVEQKLQDVQQDFHTGLQLCFDPFLLEPPKEVALNRLKRLWSVLVHKAEARIAADAKHEAIAMVILMQQLVFAIKQVYQKVQLFALGSDQSPHAFIKIGLSPEEQQEMALAAVGALAKIIKKELKKDTESSLVIDNALISSVVLSVYKQPSLGWLAWSNGKEQELVSRLVSVDLWAQYDFIAQAYYTCLHEYYKFSVSTDDATSPTIAKNKLMALADSVKKALGRIIVMIGEVDDADAKRVLDCVISHLEKILADLEICTSFADQPMLIELFALHCAIISSPGFVIVKQKEQKLALTYTRLAGMFFRTQPNNILFLTEMHTTMQKVKMLSNAKKPHEPVGLKDCIIKFVQTVSALVIGTSKEPMLDTLDQMLVIMHAAIEWQSNERKKATTLMEWMLPANLKNHPAVKNVLMNNNILTHIAALGILPAGYKIAEMMLGKKDPQADQSTQELLQLAKANPEAYAALVKQNPKILERLAAHFAPAASIV